MLHAIDLTTHYSPRLPQIFNTKPKSPMLQTATVTVTVTVTVPATANSSPTHIYDKTSSSPSL